MIHFTDSTNAMPADEAKPNWSWLQGRVETLQTRAGFQAWVSTQLAELERQLRERMQGLPPVERQALLRRLLALSPEQRSGELAAPR